MVFERALATSVGFTDLTEVFALDSRAAATEAHDQSHKKNDQEDVEQNFRNSSGRGRHTGESEDRSYQRYDQKHHCPIKHLLPPNLKTEGYRRIDIQT